MGEGKHWLDYVTAIATAAAALAAATAAAVSAYQAHISSDTEHRQLRAYLASAKMSPYAWIENLSQIRIKHTIHNFGATPAYNVKVSTDITYVDAKNKWNFFDIQTAPLTRIYDQNRIIPPSGDINIEHDVNLATHADALKTSLQVAYIYGKISFKDTFGAEEHTQFFCDVIDAAAFRIAVENPFEKGLDLCNIDYGEY